MDGTLIMAIVAFIAMFGLFVVAPTLVKRKHAQQDMERE
jgi:hypothetical protein